MKTQTAVLINPPVPDHKIWVREGRCQQSAIWGAPFPPFSLAMISAQLTGLGLETFLIDSGPEKKSIETVLEDCRRIHPKIAVLTTATPTLTSDLEWFAGQLKKTVRPITIIATGIHVSALPEKTLERFAAVDFAVIGEPELTTKELAAAILEKKSVSSVRGIAYREPEGKIRVTAPRPFVEDLDSLGFPDWTKIDFSNYRLPVKGRPFSLISFSRGCPYECRFCATHVYNGKKLRKRSIESLIQEIKFNLSLGIKDFLFWTELMTADKIYLNEFLDAILHERLESKISWVCNSRADISDIDLFRKMKEAGCWQIAFGFEFGDDRILKLVQKGPKASVSQGREAAECAARAGIAIDGHFIMGYPGETKETLQRTLDFACSLPITFAHFYAATPFPGSVLYEEAIEKQWLRIPDPSKIHQDSSCLETPHLNPSTVTLFIRKAYRAFYLRPQTILRGLNLAKKPKEYLNLIRLGFCFYRELRSE